MGTPYLDNLESFETRCPSESSPSLSDESVPRLVPSSFNNWERLVTPCQSEYGLSDIEESLPLLLMSSPSLATESLVFLVDSVGKGTVSCHELSLNIADTTRKDQNKNSRQAIPNICGGTQSQKLPEIRSKILPALTNNIEDSQLTDRKTADELIKQYTSITTSPFDCHKNLQEQSDELAKRLQEKIKYHGYNNHHVTGALPVRFDDATTSMHCYKNPSNKRIDYGNHKLKAEKSILKVKKSAEVLTDLYEAKKRNRDEKISDFDMYHTSSTKTSRKKRSRKNRNKVESIDAATDLPSSEDIPPGSKKLTKDENKLENLGNVNNVRSVSNIRNIFSRHKQSICECPAPSVKSKSEDEPGSQEPKFDVDAEPDESKNKKKSKAAAKKKKADKSKLKKVDTKSSSSVMGKLFRKHKAEAESQNTSEPGPIEPPTDVDAVPDDSQIKETITPSTESEESKTEEIDIVPSIETPPSESKERQSLDKPVPNPNRPEAGSNESQTEKKIKPGSKKKKTDKGELKSEDTEISENILRKHTDGTDGPQIQELPTDVARASDESQIKQLPPRAFTEKPKPEDIKLENVDEVPSVASIDTPEPEPKERPVTVGALYEEPRIEQEPETGEVTPEIISEEPSVSSIDAPVPMPVQRKPRRSVSARYEEPRFKEPPPYREPEPEDIEPNTISPVPSDISIDRPERESDEPEFGAESDEDYPPEPSDLPENQEPDELESYGTSKADLDNFENPGVKLQMKPNLFGALRNMFSSHPKPQTPVKPTERLCECRRDKKRKEPKPAEPKELDEPRAVKPREKSEIELSISTAGSTLGSLKCCGGSKIADIMLRTMGADMESSDDVSRPRATKFKIEIQTVGEIDEVEKRANKGCRCKQNPKQEAVSTYSCWPFKATKQKTKKEKNKKKKSKACGKCCKSRDAETNLQTIVPDSAAPCTKTNITQTTSCTPCCPLPDPQGIKTQTFRSCPLSCGKANNAQMRRICSNPFCPKRKIQVTTSCCTCETRDAQINTDQILNFCEPFCLGHSSLAKFDQSTTSCRAKPLCPMCPVPKPAAKNKQIQTNCANPVCPLHHKERCERKCCPVTASPCLQAYKARNSKTCCTKKKSSCFTKPSRGKCRGRESPKRCDKKPRTCVPKYKCSQNSLTADMGTFIESRIPPYEIFQAPSEVFEAPSEVFLRVEDMQAPRLPCPSSMQMPPMCRSPPPVCPSEIARVLGRLQMLGSDASCLCTKEAIQKDLKDIIVKLKKSRKCRKKPQKSCGCTKRTCRPACEVQPRACFPRRIQLMPPPLPCIQPAPQQAAPVAQSRVCNDNNDDKCQGFKLEFMRKKSGLPGQYCT